MAIVLTIALACATARGQCANGRCISPPLIPTRPAAPLVKPHPAIVRVGYACQESVDFGTGTIVDRHERAAYVLTCWHVFRDGWGRGRAFVRYADGREAAARVVHVDRDYDLALLEVADSGIEPLEIADEAPRIGAALKAGGYGSGIYRLADATVERYTRTQETAAGETLVAAGANRSGDSGGPVLDTRMRVVAVAWGSDGKAIYGTACPRIRRVLRAVLPPYGIVFGRRPVVVGAPIRPVGPGPSGPPARAPLAPVNPPAAICLPPDVPDSTPIPVPIAAPQNGAELAELRAEIGKLRVTIDALSARPGPPGPAGPQGPPGNAPTPQELADVLAHKPLTVQILDEKGNVTQTTQAGLGGTLRFRLVPVKQEAKPHSWPMP